MNKKLLQRQSIAALFAAVLCVGIFAQTPLAGADRFDDQIKQLQNQNNQSNAAKSVLQAQALDLSGQVNALQAEINTIRAQIADSQAKKAKTEQQIAANEAELAKQKATLAETLKAMYTDGQMSTIEAVATSNNLSEYVDKEQYRVSVQDRLVSTTKQIKALQAQLAKQKTQIEQLLSDQNAMNASVSAKQGEANRLLGLNQSQQAEYNQSMAANGAKMTDLRRQQAIENARYNVGSARKGGTGGYPWANVSYPSYSVDPWGMYKRECVSYTAWKVDASGRHMPYWGGKGNAKLWDDNARAAGIPVDGNPRVGDVAISNSGTYGHAMYVEAVNGDGTITVSQYNASWDGEYSVARRAVTGLSFIHF